MEAPWTVALTVPVAWGDMDAFGHVNNAVYLRWFESARIGYFEKLGLVTAAVTTQKGAWPILAHSAVDYRAPVVYPDTIQITARVTKLGTTSFTMAYRAHSTAQNKLAAEGIDSSTGTKTPLDPQLRSKITALENL